MPDLPQSVKAAYLHCPVRPSIPNPLRCFQCQRFGLSKTVCRSQPTYSICAEVSHDNADCKGKERCVNCKGDHSSFYRSCPTWILEKEITAVKIKNKLSYPEARHVVSARMPVSGKSYVSATSKSYASTAIQCDASTAPTSEKAESEKPKTIAVDTSPYEERVRRLDVPSFISWNCRGLRSRLDDFKSIISTYQLAWPAFQETFLKSTMTMRVRGYNCVQRDIDCDTSPTGGVCLFTSNLYPSDLATLHTSLQAVGVRIHIHSLVSLLCLFTTQPCCATSGFESLSHSIASSFYFAR
ncbi:hypothetical protein TNCV_3838251 [Trichonephila clavipes]|nr:hypothetical protein TNCV_3838251 [Trichonephila clavipes]